MLVPSNRDGRGQRADRRPETKGRVTIMKKNLMTTMLVMILAAALTATGCNTAAEQTTQTAVETITETDAETTDGASEQEGFFPVC